MCGQVELVARPCHTHSFSFSWNRKKKKGEGQKGVKVRVRERVSQRPEERGRVGESQETFVELSGQAQTIPGTQLFECHVKHPVALPFCPIHCLPPSPLPAAPCGLSALDLGGGGSPASIKARLVP